MSLEEYRLEASVRGIGKCKKDLTTERVDPTNILQAFANQNNPRYSEEILHEHNTFHNHNYHAKKTAMALEKALQKDKKLTPCGGKETCRPQYEAVLARTSLTISGSLFLQELPMLIRRLVIMVSNGEPTRPSNRS